MQFRKFVPTSLAAPTLPARSAVTASMQPRTSPTNVDIKVTSRVCASSVAQVPSTPQILAASMRTLSRAA
ncbi:hypothetical protein IG631_16162 [Alternaria alternata]|nr:hypothetical protein IG631_16162 [Alternaria alternata]